MSITIQFFLQAEITVDDGDPIQLELDGGRDLATSDTIELSESGPLIEALQDAGFDLVDIDTIIEMAENAVQLAKEEEEAGE